MAKAEPLKENVPSGAAPSRDDGVTIDQCRLCADPIRRGQVVQITLEPGEANSMGKAHLRCWRERQLLNRAMGSQK